MVAGWLGSVHLHYYSSPTDVANPFNLGSSGRGPGEVLCACVWGET